jgi:hypothetical protein
VAGPFGECIDPHLGECVVGGAKLVAGVDPTALAA